jgi:hypothetical protein
MKNRLPALASCVLLLPLAGCLPQPATTEDQAVTAIEKLGGKVVRDDKDPAKPVVTVDLSNTPVTDAGLKELAGLRGVQTLYLSGCEGVTDAGLKELAQLKGLQSLDLSGCQGVTNAGLKELAELKGLQSLDLNHCRGVTDAGLKELAALKGLRYLELRGCEKVTDAGVAELQKALPDCKIIR